MEDDIDFPTISNVERIFYTSDDVILVHTDFGRMPPSKCKDYAESVRASMKTFFPNNQILVMSNKTRITVLTQSTQYIQS